ncbi:hypothetical protein PybrP1_013041 [[Pythium] brassicae (nom. inval.)]|nr:hypothetical protein PybrP1_013041 [[Pythium] brassicae (nom. inval.)]
MPRAERASRGRTQVATEIGGADSRSLAKNPGPRKTTREKSPHAANDKRQRKSERAQRAQERAARTHSRRTHLSQPPAAMGRLAKHKAAKVASKRRKKNGPSTATTSFSTSARRPVASNAVAESVVLAAAAAASPMSGTGSTSGSSTPSSGKECEQCGNPPVLEGVAAARAWTTAGKKQSPAACGGCQICDFVLYRKSLRPCVHCERASCEHFCEWCGNGYHTKCARARDEKVNAPTGFCCRKCEAEQADDDDSASAGEKSDEEEEIGSRCGTCRLPFNATAREDESGFKVSQSVLVENDEVLYNAVITDVDLKGERIKIHFIRWSKSFDNWYAMDDEHINESLACDCCNHWFHIGCLPPIKSSGRFKDTTYVCPSCIDDAKHFHNGTRPKAKAAATSSVASSSSSGTVNKASARKSSVSDDAPPAPVAATKRKSAKPIVSSDDEQDAKRPSAKKKRKLSVSSDSPPVPKKKPELSRTSSRSKSPDPATASRGSVNDDDNDDNDDELVPDSESSTEKGASSVPASPSAAVAEGAQEDSAATAAAVNNTKKAPSAHEKLSTPSPSDNEAAEQSKENASRSSGDKPAPPANNFHRRKPSSHSVSALLNSPSPNEKPATPPVQTNIGALSMLDDGRRNLAPSFDVAVKLERHSQQLPPLPSSFASRSSSSSKVTAKIEPYQSASNWPIRPAAPSKPQGGGGGSRGPLSAFDILREVASQSIAGELDVVAASTAPAKPKKEPRPRSTAAKAKAARADKAATDKAGAPKVEGARPPELVRGPALQHPQGDVPQVLHARGAGAAGPRHGAAAALAHLPDVRQVPGPQVRLPREQGPVAAIPDEAAAGGRADVAGRDWRRAAGPTRLGRVGLAQRGVVSGVREPRDPVGDSVTATDGPAGAHDPVVFRDHCVREGGGAASAGLEKKRPEVIAMELAPLMASPSSSASAPTSAAPQLSSSTAPASSAPTVQSQPA